MGNKKVGNKKKLKIRKRRKLENIGNWNKYEIGESKKSEKEEIQKKE